MFLSCLLLVILNGVSSLNIFFVAVSHPSHFFVEIEIAKELLSRGHTIQFMCVSTTLHCERFAKSLPVENEKFVYYTARRTDEVLDTDEVVELMNNWHSSTISVVEFLVKSVALGYESVLLDLSDFLSSYNEKIDIMVGDIFVQGLFVLAREKQVEYVSIIPFFDTMHEGLNPHIPSSQSDYLAREYNFVRRFQNMYHTASLTLQFVLNALPIVQSVNEKYGIDEIFPSIPKEAVVVQTGFLGFNYPQPIRANHKMVGIIFDDSSASAQNEEDEDLYRWLETKQDVVYVSFGSVMTPGFEVVKKILMAMKDSTILFANPKWKDYVDEELLKNVKEIRGETWVNQRMVLKHDNVVAIVTHGGALSISEAVFFGKPLFVVPFLGDMFGNSARVVDSGIGVRVTGPFESRTSKDFEREMEILLGNKEKFVEKMNQIKKMSLFHGGKVRAADVVELVAEVGSEHFFLPVEVSFFARTNLDVYFSLLGILLLMVYIFYKGCCVICRRRKKGKEGKVE